MTDRSFGHALWYGVVVNVNDPEQEGRVQVRIHGLHDDTTNIPDDQLPWVKPTQDITSAGHNKIGNIPVGLIKGSTVGGYFMDDDKQNPVFDHVIAKAGDPASGSTTNGQVPLVPGTNSTPIGNRNKNNKFVTRKGKNIQQEDNASTNPVESKDSDGVDVTAMATANTKYATIPTVGSVTNPSGSILTQLTSVDPSHLTSVLPNAVANFIKLEDLHAFSSTSGITGILGQALGVALNGVGLNTFLNSISSVVNASQLSSLTQNVLVSALNNVSPNIVASPAISSIIQNNLPAMIADLNALIANPSLAALEAFIAKYFGNISAQASNASLGTNIQSILSNLSSVLPQIAGAINGTLNIHLPQSVLNQSTITTALQKFALNQAYIQAPSSGKRAIAKAAVQKGASVPSNIQTSTTSQSFVENLNA